MNVVPALIVWRSSIFIIFVGHYHSFNETGAWLYIYYLYIFTQEGRYGPAVDYNACGRIDDDLQFIRDGAKKREKYIPPPN